MSLITQFFGNKSTEALFPFPTDVHCHILPGVDDGSESVENSLLMLKGMAERGYKHIILTPHIMGDYYPNTPEALREAMLRLQVAKQGMGLPEVHLAAEYYADEHMQKLLDEGQEILSYPGGFVLVETGFMSPYRGFRNIIFELQSRGLKPVLAHPERYVYMWDDMKKLHELADLGLLFQVNLLSIIAYYSRESQRTAAYLIKNKMVHFAGTDCHKLKHIGYLPEVLQMPMCKKLFDLPLLNYTLI